MSEKVPFPRHVRIEQPWAGVTVFDAVRRAFPQVPPREIFRKARRGELRANDGPCHPLHRLDAGDVLTVVLYRTPAPLHITPLRQNVLAETGPGPFWIVWEDEDLLAVSKPPGCASHPALGHSGDTLIDRVRAYLRVCPEDGFQPALANRLDIGTSGIVLIAKTRAARRRLGRHFQKGLVKKHYLALVGGWPQPLEGEIRTPLLRRPDSRDLARFPAGHPKRRSTFRNAHTGYRTKRRYEQPLRSALLEVQLVTGRTHQIRRHLAERGHPLAGDARYGDAEFNRDLRSICDLHRTFLHAHRVMTAHPRSGEPLELVARLPSDLETCLMALGGGRLRGDAEPCS